MTRLAKMSVMCAVMMMGLSFFASGEAKAHDRGRVGFSFYGGNVGVGYSRGDCYAPRYRSFSVYSGPSCGYGPVYYPPVCAPVPVYPVYPAPCHGGSFFSFGW